MLAAAAALLVLVVLLHMALHRALRPARIRETGSPADFGLAFREVAIATARGRRLFGWFIPAPAAGPAPAVAVLHGWGGNAQMMLPAARPLHEAGFALLLFDARCHGRSDGDRFASLPRFAEDLAHAVDWLARQPEVDGRRLAALGHSVGAGAALLAASRHPGLAAVVSLAAFAHPAAMMRRWLASMGVPFIPLGWYLLHYVQFVIGHRYDDIAPVNTIRLVRRPVLLVHGADDATVPVEDARAIFARRGDTPAELVVLPGGHGSYEELGVSMQRLVAFLRRSLQERTGAGGQRPRSPEIESPRIRA